MLPSGLFRLCSTSNTELAHEKPVHGSHCASPPDHDTSQELLLRHELHSDFSPAQSANHVLPNQTYFDGFSPLILAKTRLRCDCKAKVHCGDYLLHAAAASTLPKILHQEQSVRT